MRTNITVPGFPALLTTAFIVLKLTGYIAWSWWWVVSPLWIPLAIFFGVVFGFLGICFAAFVLFMIGLVVYVIIDSLHSIKSVI